jgi:hypothetical protein
MLQSTGQISISDINTELGQSASTQNGLNDALDRQLSTIISGKIAFTDFYSKSLGTPAANGWIVAGEDIAGNGFGYSTIEKLIFAIDTATPLFRGQTLNLIIFAAGVNNLTDAWFGCGAIATDWSICSTVERLTFATDTNTDISRCSTTLAASVGASDSSANGWFAGGTDVMSTSAYFTDFFADIYKLTFATDTLTPTIRSSMLTARSFLASVSTSTGAWFGGGFISDIGYAQTFLYSNIENLTYATDTDTCVAKHNMIVARTTHSGTNNSTSGWFVGGYASGYISVGWFDASFSSVEKITFATDTASLSNRGKLPYKLSLATITSNSSTAAWVCVGCMSGYTGVSNVCKITFATDTATASGKHVMNLARCESIGA